MTQDDLDRIRSIRGRFEDRKDMALEFGLAPALAESLAMDYVGKEALAAIDVLMEELRSFRESKSAV